MRAESSISSTKVLLNALKSLPDHDVIRFSDSEKVINSTEYLHIVGQYAQCFEGLGLNKGARIALLSRNRPEVLFVNIAHNLANLALVPLHPMGSLEDFAYILQDAEVEALIFDARYYSDLADALLEKVSSLEHLFSLGPAPIGEDLVALAEGQPASDLLVPDTAPEDIVRVAYSGGTTGKPKGITLSNRAITTSLSILLSEWEWPGQNRHLVCSPLSHGGGAMVTPIIIRGGSLLVLPGFDPGAVLEAIEKHRITSTLLVPTMIYALLDHPDIGKYDLSSLEIIYYGASTISPTRLDEAIEVFGPIFFQFYGQAEAPMTVTTLKRDQHLAGDMARLSCCGRPVPWLDVELMDDEGSTVPDGEPGEICVRGPLLMSGYLNKEEQTREAMAGGWLHTGDVAVRDENGFFRIVDRKKDMIVSGGFNVFPREVEDVLNAHPAVASSAVIGIPHEKWGETVKAIVVLRQDKNVSDSELMELVKKKKGAVQAPKSIEFVDAIPLSGLGKPDKKAIRQQYSS